MTEPPPPLTESEVQAEEARHQPRDFGSEHRCVECQQDWPCPTIRLIAERERLRERIRELEQEVEFTIAMLSQSANNQRIRAEAAEARIRAADRLAEDIQERHFGKTTGWADEFLCVCCGWPYPCPDALALAAYKEPAVPDDQQT